MAGENFDQSIIVEFIIECKEHLESIEGNLIILEKDPANLEILNTIFRAIHSVKGAASFLGLKKISQLTHKMENVLDQLRKQKISINAELTDIILEGSDILIKLVLELEHLLNTQIESSSDNDLPDFDSYSEIDIEEILSKVENIKTTNTSVQSDTQNDTGKIDPIEKPSVTDNSKNNSKDMINNALSQALSVYLSESMEIFEDFTRNLLLIEKNKKDQETLNSLFRAIHNFKGNSRYLGFANTEKLAHHMENILDDFRNGKQEVNSNIIDLLFKCIDTLQELIKNITEKQNDHSPSVDKLVEQLQKYSNVPKTKSNTKKTPKPSENVSSVDLETIEIFLSASVQHVKNITEVLDKIEKDQITVFDLDVIVRAFSGLKSSANYMGFDETQKISEQMEELVREIRKEPTRRLLNFKNLLSRCLDYLKENFDSIKQTSKESPIDPLLTADIMIEIQAILRTYNSVVVNEVNETVVEETPVKPTAGSVTDTENQAELVQTDQANSQKKNITVEKTIRVDQNKLDKLMNLIGELIINRNRFSSITKKVEVDYNLPDLSKELKAGTYMIQRISDDLQATIMSARMVPVGTVFNKFPRMVRDLAKAKQKEIILHIHGEETELDKTIIEQIGDPLVHLIRNSADHGLETPDERKKSGKTAEGNIFLRASHEGNNVVIEIEDDGRGIDPAKLKKKALEKGLISQADYTSMSDDAAINLIFAPGFSTAEQVSNISGRGVGMDVVRDNINKLNGRIQVETNLGKGSKFSLILPLTMAIVETIMVRIHSNVFAIPLQYVGETVQVKPENIKYLNKRKSINLRDKVVGIEDLADILDIKRMNIVDGNNEELISVVILNADGKRIGFIVDELLEKQEVVIKPLIDYLACIKGISGATILGDGSVILILEPNELVNLATQTE